MGGVAVLLARYGVAWPHHSCLSRLKMASWNVPRHICRCLSWIMHGLQSCVPRGRGRSTDKSTLPFFAWNLLLPKLVDIHWLSITLKPDEQGFRITGKGRRTSRGNRCRGSRFSGGSVLAFAPETKQLCPKQECSWSFPWSPQQQRGLRCREEK